MKLLAVTVTLAFLFLRERVKGQLALKQKLKVGENEVEKTSSRSICNELHRHRHPQEV
jgi:hypothetical protein